MQKLIKSSLEYLMHDFSKNIFFKFLLLSFLAVFSLNINAQQFSDWWVDIKNDRANKIKTMLNQGANPNQINDKGQPSIMYAIEQQSWQVYDLLANHKKTFINANNKNRETPLMYLAVVGETKRAEHLISKGALFNRPDANWTALHYAASTGKADTVQMLVNKKARVNALAADGTTPLMMAAYSGDRQTVQVLLDAGANIHFKSSEGHSVVDWAMLRSHTKLAQELIDIIDLQMGAKPVQKSQSNQPENSNANSNTSKYFDLDRFDEPLSP